MARYNWHQLIKLGKTKVLELAEQLGVFNLAIAFFEKKQRGAYFKAASVVYRVLKSLSELSFGEFKYYPTPSHPYFEVLNQCDRTKPELVLSLRGMY